MKISMQTALTVMLGVDVALAVAFLALALSV